MVWLFLVLYLVFTMGLGCFIGCYIGLQYENKFIRPAQRKEVEKRNKKSKSIKQKIDTRR